MKTAHASAFSGIAAVLLCLAGDAPVGAQPPGPPEPDQTLIRAPRLTESPGSARLAPPPQDGERVLEEVIVVNESEWRLPDLGSPRQACRRFGPRGGDDVGRTLKLFSHLRRHARSLARRRASLDALLAREGAGDGDTR